MNEVEYNLGKEDLRMKYEINVEGLLVKSNEELSKEEASGYIAYAHEHNLGREIDEISLEFNGEDVNLGVHSPAQGFEKIRRITGYLVGTVDRFNNAKKAEVDDRVKHM